MLLTISILLFVLFFLVLAVTLFCLCRAGGMADRKMYRDKWRGGEEFVVPDPRADRERRIREYQR